jgi:hypothetical protein
MKGSRTTRSANPNQKPYRSDWLAFDPLVELVSCLLAVLIDLLL